MQDRKLIYPQYRLINISHVFIDLHDDIIKWKHFAALLTICEFPAQRPVTRSFDVFFDLRLN